MNAPAATTMQSPLEAVLRDVHVTLADMLEAAEQQYAAVVARDRDRIERVTRQQEQLSSRLARAEARRLEILNGASLTQAIAALPEAQAAPCAELRAAIATSVAELKARQGRTANLLNKTIEMSRQTLEFIQRLVTAPNPVYGRRGYSPSRRSLLVDSRA